MRPLALSAAQQYRLQRLARDAGRTPRAMLKFVLRDGFEACEEDVRENLAADAGFAAGKRRSKLTLDTEVNEVLMSRKLTMVYWKSDQFWLGKLLEHPEIMTQGESVEELEENLKDAFRLMAMDEVPQDYETKEIAL